MLFQSKPNLFLHNIMYTESHYFPNQSIPGRRCDHLVCKFNNVVSHGYCTWMISGCWRQVCGQYIRRNWQVTSRIWEAFEYIVLSLFTGLGECLRIFISFFMVTFCYSTKFTVCCVYSLTLRINYLFSFLFFGYWLPLSVDVCTSILIMISLFVHRL